MKIISVSILIEITEFSVLVLASTTLFSELLTWNDANQYCKGIGQHLVTIDEQVKQQFLHEALLEIENNAPNFEGDIWVGLHVPDPNQPTNRVWTNDCVSSNSFSNWSPGLNSNNDNLCAYVEVEDDDMHWLLANCGTDRKSFLCESDTTICYSKFSYEIEDDTRASIGLSGIETPGTEEVCINHCNTISFCWAFSFHPSEPKCELYAKYDGPYYTNNDQISAPGENLYMKRSCNFELNEDNNVLSVPPYDDCGSVVVSDCVVCVTTEEKTTTEYTTTTKKGTTSLKVSSVDKTSETTIPPTTENHVSSALDLTSSDFPTTILPTTENHVRSALEVTSLEFATTTTQSEITSIAKSSINPTAHNEQNRGKTPYCVCTCNNVTKQMSLEESINEIVNEIKIDSTKTSAYTRKHTSAWDSRKSSESIGFVGITILISVASLLLCLDSTSFIYRMFALLRKPDTSSNVYHENGR